LKRQMQILKLGGSVITHKDGYFSANHDLIKNLAFEIAESKVKSLIIVHGAGSFGHPLAKQYSISDGLKYPEQLTGFSKTHQSMILLNRIIVDALLNENIPAFSVCPSSFLLTSGKRLLKIDLRIIKQLLDIGLIPVMYGDAVLDTRQGIAILSGDQLVTRLAIEFGAKRIIFGSDVDGIFTSNPKIDGDAQLIEKLSISNVTAKIGDAINTDVTGGMLGKVSEAEDAVRAGSQVIFLNACKKNRVNAALKGERVMGTILTL
jgi:isopentenyl phosphate kinase